MKNVIHVEHNEEILRLEDLQFILFDYFKIKTGNASKIKISNFPSSALKVEWDEILPGDWRKGIIDGINKGK